MAYHDTVWDANHGLRFFSQTLATKDFQRYRRLKRQQILERPSLMIIKGSDGQSIYKNQLVETFTVGFGLRLYRMGTI